MPSFKKIVYNSVKLSVIFYWCSLKTSLNTGENIIMTVSKAIKRYEDRHGDRRKGLIKGIKSKRKWDWN